MPTLITKYCSPAGLAGMLGGNFRLGTHQGFAQAEGGAALGEAEEGNHHFLIKGKVDALHIGGFHASGGTFDGSGPVALQVTRSVNFFIFCACAEKYSVTQHNLMMSGDQQYAGNPDYTAYIEFDAGKLLYALGDLARWKCNSAVAAKYGPVVYNDRRTHVPTDKNGRILFESPDDLDKLFEAAFSKPSAFKLENEMRLCLAPLNHDLSHIKPFDGADAPQSIKDQLRSAIVSKGLLDI